MTVTYSNYPPIDIAIAAAAVLNRLQPFGVFSLPFTSRWSFGDFSEKLERAPNNLPWVDVVPPVKPTSELDGRYWYKHGVPIRIGVRVKLKGVTVDWSEAVDPEAIAQYVKLLYEIKDYFDPSSVNPQGRSLKDDIPGAVMQGGCRIIKAWDPELLADAKVYCGIIEVPFALKVSRTTDFPPDDGSGVDPGSNWEPWFGLPRGGEAGQVLSKVDATDYHAEWSAPTGGLNSSDLISLVWGTPAVEVGDEIEISATLENYDGGVFASSIVDVEILVSDGATDNEPSATATLEPAADPVGTVLAGSGTARLVVRSDSGSLKVKVKEPTAAHRYLWLKAGGNARLWVRSKTGVQELIFA